MVPLALINEGESIPGVSHHANLYSHSDYCKLHFSRLPLGMLQDLYKTKLYCDKEIIGERLFCLLNESVL